MQQQCQNCDSKDQITIAGKNFCANCGSPVEQSSDKQNTNINPVESTTPKTLQSDPVSTGTPSVDPPQEPQSSSTSTTDAPRPQGDPITAPTISTVSKFSTPPNTTQTQSVEPPANISPIATAPQHVERPALPVNTAVSSDGIQPARTHKPPIAGVINQYAGQSSPSPTFEMLSGKNIGNEISTLDGNDENVFSDAQLDELAKALPQSGPTPATAMPTPVARPMQDIAPTAAPAMPSPVQPVISNAAQPAINPSPIGQAQSLDINSHPEAPRPQAGARIMPTNTPVSDVNPAAAQAATQAASQAAFISSQAEEQEKPKKKVLPKVASAAVTAVGVILLGVYVWQINYPNLALKVAGSKAGISASLPSYLPNGWRIVGDIQSNPGSVSYDLQSSNNKVSVSQTKTDWDSQALAENYLQNKVGSYTAVQAQGLTIYLYNNQASWVNHGTWYKIEGDNNGLNQDQLIKMATSL